MQQDEIELLKKIVELIGRAAEGGVCTEFTRGLLPASQLATRKIEVRLPSGESIRVLLEERVKS